MRVVVTGASGKIGRYVCQVLAERGHDVLGLDLRLPETPAPWPVEAIDCGDYDAMRSRLEGVEGVCHLGEIPTMSRRLRTVIYARNTAVGSAVMLAAADAKVQAFAYASSCQAYGPWATFMPPARLPVDETHPLLLRNAYAASKAANEGFLAMLVARGDLPSAVAIRMPVVYSGTRPEGWPPLAMTGPVERELGTWLHSLDAAALFASAVEKRPAGFHPVHGSASWLHTTEPIADRIAKHHSDWPQLPAGWGADQSVIDFRRTSELLDWTPVHSDAVRPAIRGAGVSPA
jgi:nucleoside-diphosphate-sugar epimerase